jgi:WD40 repeat protein
VPSSSGLTSRVVKKNAVLRGHTEHVTSADISRDGSRIVTASADDTARIWDAGSGNEIAILRGHEDAVLSAVFSPDRSRILTASVDKTARIWDAASAKQTAVLRGHEGPVVSAVFSPDGSRIVTASQDNTARIWDVRLTTIPPEKILSEACVRLAGVTKLTREDMRLAGYPDNIPEIDVCQ